MASVVNDPGGHKRITFVNVDRQHKAFRLGRVSNRVAEKVKEKVETINANIINGVSNDGDTAKWLAEISDILHAKLAKAGLVEPRKPPEPKPQVRLGEFLASYIAGRTDHGENTRKTINQARRLLIEHFGPEKPIENLTAADAANWQTMLRSRFAPATVSTHVKKAKQMFQHAADANIIVKSPFAKLKAGKQVDSTRQVFIEHERIEKVIDAAPDAEWRLIIALARYGGLRCPSEFLPLKWSDIDWERDRFRVTSPKTEHQGKSERWIPLFPELRPFFEDAHELATVGTEYVISRYRVKNANLRTQFERIIRKAGLEPWERLFHNLRGSRQTELTDLFPAHVVCAWLGNSVKVANDHYLRVTADHFARAILKSGAQSGADETQKAAQHRPRTEHVTNEKTLEKSRVASNSPSFSAIAEYPRQESNL